VAVKTNPPRNTSAAVSIPNRGRKVCFPFVPS